MPDYDIGKAFAEIEDNLIASMIRNLSKHRAEETELGFEWSQWQVEQLKALEDYRRRNQKIFPSEFNRINQQIRRTLQDSYNDGGTKQEQQILQAIKQGFKGKGTNAPAFTGKSEIGGEFFKINDDKLNALIQATTHDMEKAETAVLRMANDQYRKTIFNAQVYANSGAGTYAQAVDMATKDFLSAGINCIEYQNGRRVNIKSYAEMALRTAGKRAYLQGEGDKRREWGVTTVILNKRSNPCPLCAPFVGKVFIDDVWSGGSKDGISPVTGIKYPLLSEAIAQGLYHPNCRDSHTTYFEGVSTPPENNEYTTDELDEIAQNYNNQQKANHAEHEAERMERMSKFSLDKDNQRIYGARAKQWRSTAEEYEGKVHHIGEPDKNSSAEITENSIQNVANSDDSGIISYEYSGKVTKEVREAFDTEYTAMADKFGKISTISRVEPLLNGADYGEYYDHSGVLSIRFANKKNCLSQLAQKAAEMKKAGKWSSAHPMHVLRHEIGHAIQAEHAKNDPLWGDKLKKIKQIMAELDEPFSDYTGTYSVSQYAMQDLYEFISECIAESMSKKARKTAKQVVKIILGDD